MTDHNQQTTSKVVRLASAKSQSNSVGANFELPMTAYVRQRHNAHCWLPGGCGACYLIDDWLIPETVPATFSAEISLYPRRF